MQIKFRDRANASQKSETDQPELASDLVSDRLGGSISVDVLDRSDWLSGIGDNKKLIQSKFKQSNLNKVTL